MALARRIIVFIVGSLSFVAGMNLSVPSLTTLARYVIYARPMITDAVPMGSAAQASPIFSLALSAFLGLLLAAAGIALIMRYR